MIKRCRDREPLKSLTQYTTLAILLAMTQNQLDPSQFAYAARQIQVQVQTPPQQQAQPPAVHHGDTVKQWHTNRMFSPQARTDSAARTGARVVRNPGPATLREGLARLNTVKNGSLHFQGARSLARMGRLWTGIGSAMGVGTGIVLIACGATPIILPIAIGMTAGPGTAILSGAAMTAARGKYLQMKSQGKLNFFKRNPTPQPSSAPAEATPEIIDHLFNEQCSICMESFTEGQELLYGKCSHGFHKECISNWMATHANCPDCRLVTPPADLCSGKVASPSA